MNTTPIVRKKVLVIDDNTGILFVMQQALALKNYHVELSESFRGVSSIEKSAPDMIYLDISLAGRDGREVAQALKKHAGTKHIPIVILTAYPDADLLTKEAGAEDFLPKPFALEELWKMTAKYVAHALK